MEVSKAPNDGSIHVETTPDDWSDPNSQNGAADVARRVVQSATSGAEGGNKTLVERVLLLVGGIVLILVGIPMLILPGPGLVCIVGGLACIAGALGISKKQHQ